MAAIRHWEERGIQLDRRTLRGFEYAGPALKPSYEEIRLALDQLTRQLAGLTIAVNHMKALWVPDELLTDDFDMTNGMVGPAFDNPLIAALGIRRTGRTTQDDGPC